MSTTMSATAREALAAECESCCTYGADDGFGAGDLGVIIAELKLAAAAIRAGDWLAAFTHLWAAAQEAQKASVPVFGAGEDAVPMKGKWADLFAKILSLLLKLLPLLV